MRKTLIGFGLLGALLIPAQASALEVSPEKQATMNARGWSATDSLSSVPVPTESGDGRSCERASVQVAIRNANHNVDVRGSAGLMACERNGHCVEHRAFHGWGSPGRHWQRKTPTGYPWFRDGWVNRDWRYASRTQVGFEFGSTGSWWYLTAKVYAHCANNDVRFKRETSVR